ncbi:MAG: serine/threonine protein kinase [Myxococcota bacterium]|nr:serine/threonine protein kinase [Myxococcota bacterium]
MVSPLKAAPGQTLEGRFLLLEEIGRGGMSTVFKASDLANERQPVAVKVPLPLYASGIGSWSLFQREAEIGATLAHPYVLRFIPLAPSKHRGHVVTEYLAGMTLSAHIADGKPLPEPEALRVMSRLCEAVAYLHGRRIVHYDLKPANVMLCDDGSIRLIDFGMAHRIERSRLAFAGPGPPMASAAYVAPEQIRRKRGQPSVDIYALGAMLYELLTGHPPFEGDDPFVVASARQIGDPKAPRALNPAVSEQAEEIVLRAMRRDPTDRYASAAELKADLDRPAQVRVSGLADHLVAVTRWRKHARWIRFVALVAVGPLAFLVVSFRLLWWYLEQKR